MAARPEHFTASQVGEIVTADTEDDREFIFPGSDDDFDAGQLEEEYDYDPLGREQGKYVYKMT